MRCLKIVLIISLLLVTGVVCADERSEALDREATNLYQQVFSPFCPGRSLNDCPSSKAAELKDEMRAQLKAGKSSEAVLQEVFQKYGDQYRTVPKFAGVGILVWLVPASFVLIGLILAVSFSLRKKKASAVKEERRSTQLSAEDERRVQEELARLE